MVENPNLRAVPNPPEESDDRKELVKTTILTSLVATLIGVSATAGFWAIFNVARNAIRKRRGHEEAPLPPPYHAYDNAPPEYQYDAQMPEALRMNVRLRPQRRRRGSAPMPPQQAAPQPQAAATEADPEELRAMLAEFQANLNDRFSHMEKRIDELYEEEVEEDDD